MRGMGTTVYSCEHSKEKPVYRRNNTVSRQYRVEFLSCHRVAQYMCKERHHSQSIKIRLCARRNRICRLPNISRQSPTIQKISAGYQQIPDITKHHRCSFLIWSPQPGSLCVCYVRENGNMSKLFEESKIAIIKAIQKRVQIFDKSRPTCLTRDWSKSGIGFWLSQKHCNSATVADGKSH